MIQLKVANGGLVFANVPSTVTGGSTDLFFMNKRIPRTQLTLFPPGGVIGKGLVIVADDANLGPQFCGAIVTA
jgi:hypothetical protein